jgi:hypothetical protein
MRKMPNFEKLGRAWAQSAHTVTLCTHAYAYDDRKQLAVFGDCYEKQ